jgi:hypothetical protein
MIFDDLLLMISLLMSASRFTGSAFDPSALGLIDDGIRPLW